MERLQHYHIVQEKGRVRIICCSTQVFGEFRRSDSGIGAKTFPKACSGS